MDARPSPHAIEAEQALLGGLMIDPDQCGEVEREVAEADFYRPDHAKLFGLIRQMWIDGEHIDRITLGERLLRGEGAELYGDYGYVIGLPDRVPSRVNLAQYARVIREKSLMRRILRASENLREETLSGTFDAADLLRRASHAFLDIADDEMSRDWEQVSTISDREMLRIERLSKDPNPTPGLTTGFYALDKILTGLHPQTMVVLAARPGMGKTALALNIAQNAAVLGRVAVAIFSLEMGRGELVTRLLCCAGLVEGGKVKRGTLDEEEWARLDGADRMMHEARIFIDDTPGVTIEDIRSRSRRLKAKHQDLGLIVIDYLQLMQGTDPRANRQQQISDISRGLKILSKELDVPVIALSQLNRQVDGRQDKRPLLSDLRESGAIEQDADVILFIYRDEVYNPETTTRPGLADVIIAKHRSGPTGVATLVFRKSFTRFDDLDPSGVTL